VTDDAFTRLLNNEITSEEYVAHLRRQVREREFVNGDGKGRPLGILNTPGITATIGGNSLDRKTFQEAVDAVSSQGNPTPKEDPVPDATSRKTVGVDPKVPVQAIVTLVVALLAYFGVNLDAEVSGALGIIIGALAAVVAPAAKTVVS